MTNGDMVNNNFLKQVIFRIEFRNISELLGDGGNPEKFLNIIKDFFPIGEVSEDIFVFSIQNENKNHVWTNYDVDKNKFIELTCHSISLVYNGVYYDSHKSLFNEINLIKEILNAYNVSFINKIGLRYINEFIPNFEIKNWDDWINPKLHNFNNINSDLRLTRAITTAEYKVGNYDVTFNYGQFNLNYPKET